MWLYTCHINTASFSRSAMFFVYICCCAPGTLGGWKLDISTGKFRPPTEWNAALGFVAMADLSLLYIYCFIRRFGAWPHIHFVWGLWHLLLALLQGQEEKKNTDYCCHPQVGFQTATAFLHFAQCVPPAQGTFLPSVKPGRQQLVELAN